VRLIFFIAFHVREAAAGTTFAMRVLIAAALAFPLWSSLAQSSDKICTGAWYRGDRQEHRDTVGDCAIDWQSPALDSLAKVCPDEGYGPGIAGGPDGPFCQFRGHVARQVGKTYWIDKIYLNNKLPDRMLAPEAK
jgi:hypothetical protein